LAYTTSEHYNSNKLLYNHITSSNISLTWPTNYSWSSF